MAHRKTKRNPLFAGRWFEDNIILLCLRWYFRFKLKLSYRDLVEILGERGLAISHTTILRWVVRYAENLRKTLEPIRTAGGGSWRVDETFIKVEGSRFGCLGFGIVGRARSLKRSFAFVLAWCRPI